MALLESMLSYLFLNNITSIILFCVIFFLGYSVLLRKRHILPPGPRALPVLGNVFLVKGRDLRDVFRECRQTYGDIFSLKIFNKRIIVFNGYGVLKDFFMKEGDKTSDRFTNAMVDFALGTDDTTGVLFSSGAKWKHNRRFSLHHLRNFGMGKNIIQVKIHEEIGHLMAEVDNHEGEPFDVKRLIHNASANIISSVLFGNRFPYGDPEFEDFHRRLDENISGSGNILLLTPVLRLLPGDPFKVNRIADNIKVNMELIAKHCMRHKESFTPGIINDLSDAYLDEWHKAKESGDDSGYSDVEMHSIVTDLMIAGTETSASTMRWFLLYMIHHPEIQKRIQAEIDEYVPENRLPNMNDKQHLVNFEAAILETQRIAPIVPLSVPHRAANEFEYNGWQIPREAVLIPNLDSVMLDETLFPNPREFRPSRFIDKDNKIIRMDELIPFSIGRRVCLGESLAKSELFLFLSAFLQRYEILPPEQCSLPPIAGTLGITFGPNSFQARFVKRHQCSRRQRSDT